MSSWTPTVSALAACWLLTACTPIESPPNGELGNGSFFYHCDSDSDPVCDGQVTGSTSSRMPLPSAVAVGARFSIEYEAAFSGDDPGGSTTIESASAEILVQTEPFGPSFKGIKPGLAAILARRGDTITDFIHVLVKVPAGVRVDSTGGQAVSAVDLDEGSSETLRAFFVDDTDAQLAGAASASWKTSDDAIAALDGLTTDNEVGVLGAKAGSATLTVQLGDEKQDVEVTVVATTEPTGGGQ